MIQATSGCTYNKCKFCSLYHGECFRMTPINEFEEDLAEIKSHQPHARRLFWTGANPFAMSYENLKERALTVRDYLIKCQSIAMFSSIRDIKPKSVEQLRKLRAMGINGLSIGMESGDDETLAFVNKGYTATDIVEQLAKLDEAGIEYYLVYMTGLAGKGNGQRNALNTSETLNQISPYFVENPYFLNIDSLTLFPDTELYKMAQHGEFTPADEKERLEELITLLQNLRLRTRVQADTISNFKPLTGFFPKEKKEIIGKLQHIINTSSEKEMRSYRDSLKSLGAD
ncbi:radical SAM protein [Anaerocolumna sedimenticola]|uniref:Radical SAM protein n=1 Tax=Anaerocolumna sedimenticola TaxID=2696063 RepID=A0A6P1TWJ0_9FIRM|nr:radical SAM protein [Anaerocolumna sedimenticola]QHQ63785.1 radical SAM protein [Anaerocolumna sedimenticola]